MGLQVLFVLTPDKFRPSRQSRFVQNLVNKPNMVLYVHMVDKGAEEMWLFCSKWVWDTEQEFLCKEGYSEVCQSMDVVMCLMTAMVEEIGGGGGGQLQPQMCRLDHIAKAQSLLKGPRLCRPSASNPKLVGERGMCVHLCSQLVEKRNSHGVPPVAHFGCYFVVLVVG